MKTKYYFMINNAVIKLDSEPKFEQNGQSKPMDGELCNMANGNETFSEVKNLRFNSNHVLLRWEQETNM